MRNTGKADVTGLFKYFKEHVDPEFLRFETNFRSRTVPELTRLAAFFKAWNDNPAGSGEAVVEVEVGETPVEAAPPSGTSEQQLQDLEKKLNSAHQEEIHKLEGQLRDALSKNDQAAAALERNNSFDRRIAAFLTKLPASGFDTAIVDLKEHLTQDTRSYCRVHGILYAGELWALKEAPTGVDRDMLSLCEAWKVNRNADVVRDGYIPRYWLNPEFYTTCSLEVSEVLRPGQYARRTRMEGYLEPNQKVGDFLRKWKGVPGKLQDFQHCLDKQFGEAVHAGCYVPEDWTP